MFKVNELLKATGGRLIRGRGNIIIQGVSIDSRTVKKNEAFIAIKGSNFDGHDFIDEAIKKGANCVIQESPHRPIAQSPAIVFIKVKDTIKALGDIARFQRRKFDIPVIAVTGSNGKTTVKEMIAGVLSKRFRVLKNEGTKNNQIGLPLALLGLKPGYEIAVLEIGTNHFGEVDYLAKVCLPNIGVITNIGPAHLEYLHNLKGVLREKYALIENLKNPHLAILNSDDLLLRSRMLKKTKKPFILGFGVKHHTDFYAGDIKRLSDRLEFSVNPALSTTQINHKIRKGGVKKKYKFTLRALGRHNIYNALAATAVARVFGMEYKDIVRQIAVFNFPAGRLKLVTLKKVRFIDDTYNSNPLSLKEALDTLANFRTPGRKIFVMGDMLELGSRQESFHCHAGRRVKGVCDIFITVGRLSGLAAQQARSCGFKMKNIFICESALAARDILFNKVLPRPDDLVLVKGSRLLKMEEIIKE